MQLVSTDVYSGTVGSGLSGYGTCRHGTIPATHLLGSYADVRLFLSHLSMMCFTTNAFQKQHIRRNHEWISLGDQHLKTLYGGRLADHRHVLKALGQDSHLRIVDSNESPIWKCKVCIRSWHSRRFSNTSVKLIILTDLQSKYRIFCNFRLKWSVWGRDPPSDRSLAMCSATIGRRRFSQTLGSFKFATGWALRDQRMGIAASRRFFGTWLHSLANTWDGWAMLEKAICCLFMDVECF